MVIGERFAWGHLQKTAGDATLAMFLMFPRLVLVADPAHTNEKHCSFSSRADLIEGKTLASNFRRLPNWILSWAHHRVNHSQRFGESRTFESPEKIAGTPRADWRLSELTDGGKVRIDRWLRQERIAEDFLEFISDFTDVTNEERQRVLQLGRVNALDYDHDPHNWFSEEQIALMYRRNPVWASIERQLYGELYKPSTEPLSEIRAAT